MMDQHNMQRKVLEDELVSFIPALQKFARRFHSSPGDVDDLVQETVMKGLSNLDKYQPGTQLKSWLFTIMRNTFCTKFGLLKREHVGLDDDCASRSAVQPAQEWSVRGHELEAAIGRLPEHYRAALDLVFIQGVSYEVAAQSFDCPIGTVKSRVNRAREILTRELR
jgi:RNA polymerase sigma factor (sigma-70 family)